MLGVKQPILFLNKAFGIVEGIAVDTHVYRIATRLALTRAATPLAAEQDLLALIPHDLWHAVNETWIRFGREICSARAPQCDGCPLEDICPSAGHPALAPRKKRGVTKRQDLSDSKITS